MLDEIDLRILNVLQRDGRISNQDLDLVAGDCDYLLRVVVHDLEEFRDFHMNSLAKIPGVGNVKSHISMKQVKYSTALPLKGQ